MEDQIITITPDEMYADLGMSDETYEAIVDQSLRPRHRDTLYDKLGQWGLTATQRVLDIGAYNAYHAVEIAKRYGCQVVAMEPVAKNRDLAQTLVSESAQTALVEVVDGRIEAIAASNATFDFVWSRDMLNHSADLPRAFVECARVLRPSGTMLLHSTFATELLEPGEAARLFPALAVAPDTTVEAKVRQAWEGAGLRMVEREVIGGEWREHWEEDGTRYTSDQLLRISRLLRDRDNKIAQLGLSVYASELADCTWGVYHLLGKLAPIVFILRKD